MPKKVLATIENETVPEPVDEEILSDDEEIEIKKAIKQPKVKAEKEKPEKPESGCKPPVREKKERTQAQKDAWARCIEARQAKRTGRAEKKEVYNKELEEYKKGLELKKHEKFVKKAVAIKKRHQIVDEVLDEMSDNDDIPDEVIKEKIQKRRAAAKPKPKPKPQYDVEEFEQQYLPPQIRFIH